MNLGLLQKQTGEEEKAHLSHHPFSCQAPAFLEAPNPSPELSR